MGRETQVAPARRDTTPSRSASMAVHGRNPRPAALSADVLPAGIPLQAHSSSAPPGPAKAPRRSALGRNFAMERDVRLVHEIGRRKRHDQYDRSTDATAKLKASPGKQGRHPDGTGVPPLGRWCWSYGPRRAVRTGGFPGGRTPSPETISAWFASAIVIQRRKQEAGCHHRSSEAGAFRT